MFAAYFADVRVLEERSRSSVTNDLDGCLLPSGYFPYLLKPIQLFGWPGGPLSQQTAVHTDCGGTVGRAWLCLLNSCISPMRLTRCHRLASTSVKTQWIGANLGSLALDDGTTNRNWGFSDQVAALDWVRANIQDFGGDLDRIAITGQSFGAIYVTSMLGSPKAAGKFSGLLHRAIRLVRFSVFRMPGAMIFQL